MPFISTHTNTDLADSQLREFLVQDLLLCNIRKRLVAMFHLETIGASIFLAERGAEIQRIMVEATASEKLDHRILSVIDPDESATYLMAHDAPTRHLLAAALGCRFHKGIARLNEPKTHKDIRPILLKWPGLE